MGIVARKAVGAGPGCHAEHVVTPGRVVHVVLLPPGAWNSDTVDLTHRAWIDFQPCCSLVGCVEVRELGRLFGAVTY